MAVGIDPLTTCSRPPLTGSVRRLAPNLQRIVAPNPEPADRARHQHVRRRHPARAYLVIDPGPDDTTHIDRILAATNARISHVLCTHSHPDHSPGAAALKASTQAIVLGRPAPRDDHQDESYRPDGTLDDGDVIEVSRRAAPRAITRRATLEPRLPAPRTGGLAADRRSPDERLDRRHPAAGRVDAPVPRIAAAAAHAATHGAAAGARRGDAGSARRDRSRDRASAASAKAKWWLACWSWVAPPRSANWCRSCTPTRRSRCIALARYSLLAHLQKLLEERRVAQDGERWTWLAA